ncbi:MAG: hypothetical protein ABW043_18410 [Devosia sp.]|uniref:hypothetical protein n=1 Tax=Devosia sp. TaxID=1871048 RepID=UPI003395320D
MADKKSKYVPFVTEVMVARCPRLNEPDTEGLYSDGKYKTEATADEFYTKTLQKMIQAKADEYFGGKRCVHLPWKKPKDGRIAFMFKSPKKKPELFDAKGAPLKPNVRIGEGALIRISGVMAAWEKGTKRGVSLWPDAVRVIKLADSFNAGAAFGPPEDGYDGSTSA